MLRDEITDADIAQCTTFREALRMSWRRSGKTIEQISLSLLPHDATLSDVTNMTKNLSRIINPRSPEDKRNLDGDMLIPFMVATGNSIPLRWLFLKYQPAPSVTVSNADLLAKIDTLEGLFLSSIKNIQQASRRARARGGLTTVRMSITDIVVPVWLLADVTELSGGHAHV